MESAAINWPTAAHNGDQNTLNALYRGDLVVDLPRKMLRKYLYLLILLNHMQADRVCPCRD